MKLVVIDLSPSPIIDITATEILRDLKTDLIKKDISLRIANANGKVRDILRAAGMDDTTGEIKLDSSVNDVIKAWTSEQQDLSYVSYRKV